jgi:hypothetical protein
MTVPTISPTGLTASPTPSIRISPMPTPTASVRTSSRPGPGTGTGASTTTSAGRPTGKKTLRIPHSPFTTTSGPESQYATFAASSRARSESEDRAAISAALRVALRGENTSGLT